MKTIFGYQSFKYRYKEYTQPNKNHVTKSLFDIDASLIIMVHHATLFVYRLKYPRIARTSRTKVCEWHSPTAFCHVPIYYLKEAFK